MIHAVGYRIRTLTNGRSQISICVFGAVHLTVEATLDSQTAKVSPPTVLIRGTTGEGHSREDLTAEECDGSCHDTIHSVRLMVELCDAVEHDVRSATRELLVRLQR
jgi:hypothetical protein